ncbi:MAG: ATP-dependent Clp protease proteolytic subunit [Clostridiales bacterium]|nr:ATP-dependent Clp protease proteolytic subunit [Clostridiales bacterium]
MNIPAVIERTSEGIQRCEIQDVMLQRREIDCVGEINRESVNAIILQLRYLQSLDDAKEITIFVNSPGGSIDDGLALIDVMAALRCPIRTVCVGLAASMGALLFASGDKRDILPHGRVMIHDPLIAGGVGGSALKLDAVARNLMKARETIAQILSDRTGHTVEEVYEKTAADTYFDAQEALEWGLADRIIHEI